MAQIFTDRIKNCYHERHELHEKGSQDLT